MVNAFTFVRDGVPCFPDSYTCGAMRVHHSVWTAIGLARAYTGDTK